MKIVFIHQFNNFSGSPNVLSVVARGMIERGHDVEILTNRSHGFLSDIDGARYRFIHFRWYNNSKFLTLISLCWMQIELFFSTLCSDKKSIFYINTITPFGAILGCTLSGKKFVVHVHEDMQQHKPLYGIYRKVFKWFNRHSIFVSEYVKSKAICLRDSIVAYNGLNADFTNTAAQSITPIDQRHTLLMLCSLRSYKGINEFLELARRLPDTPFEMVVSDSLVDVETFAKANIIPSNMTILPAQHNVHPFYRRAKIVLNLSRPAEWVETFGLTLLEAMSYGIPVIYPNVGGPAEVARDAVDGFMLDPTDLNTVTLRVTQLLTNSDLYEVMTKNALQRASNFDSQNMVTQIEKYLETI